METGINRKARSRRRTLALGVVIALLSSMLGVVVNATPAGASHGRANQLTWTKTTGNTVDFSFSGSWRCTYYFTPCSSAQVGNTFNTYDYLYFGDGGGATITATIASVDTINDVITAKFTTSHTYATSGPFTAYTSSCCRLSNYNGHINNPDGNYRAQTVVDLAATSASPVSSLPPIVDCAIGAVCSFAIPAFDPDGGALRWRLSTPAESSLTTQPGPPHAPNAASLNPTTGVYTWDTTDATLAGSGSTFYSTAVTIENLDGNNNVVASIGMDFFIRLGSNSTNQQPQFTAPTPADGTVINATVGSPVTFDVAAMDPDSGDVVTLDMMGKPGAATFTTTNANPASGQFTWTPTAVETRILTLTAKDPQGLGATPRSITINVTAGQTNVPPVVDAGAAVSGDVGAPIALNGSATDADGDTLALAWSIDPACSITPANAAVATVTCSVAGTYTATLTANDGHNPAVSDTTTVTVTKPTPTDTTKPVCELVSASSAGITVRAIDPDSGLATIAVTRDKNANVNVPSFNPGDTGEQIITATKIKAGQGASVQLEVTDVAGNVTVCDPVIAKLTAGETKTFHGVPAAEHFLTVSEADGVAGVAVDVGGSTRIVWSPDGRTVDLGDMGDGTVTMRVLAPEGTTATIMLWDGK